MSMFRTTPTPTPRNHSVLTTYNSQAMVAIPSPPAIQGLNIVVCGSGNGAQTAAGHLAAQGHNVWLYFSPGYAERAAAVRAAIAANGGAILLDVLSLDGSSTTTRAGPVRGVSTDAAAVMQHADIIILSVAGPAMDGLARELAPHLRPTQLLLYLQGLGCVNFLQLRRAMDAAGGRPLPMLAASRTLPWVCRVLEPAHVNVSGTKASVGLVLPPGTPSLEAAMRCRLLHRLFPETTFDTTPDPVDASFLPFNIFGSLVLHPGIMLDSWASYTGQTLQEKPLFYTTARDTALDAVEGLQAEAQAVVVALYAAVGLAEPPATPDLRAQLEAWYGPAIGDPSTLGSVLRTNAAYKGVYHHMKRSPSGSGWVPDFRSRMLTEDVPCGLVPIRGAAQILGVPTPWIDRVVEWAQAKMGREYLVGGRLEGRDVASTDAPQAYGVTTPQQLVISLDCAADASEQKCRPQSCLSARLECARLETSEEVENCIGAARDSAVPHQ